MNVELRVERDPFGEIAERLNVRDAVVRSHIANDHAPARVSTPVAIWFAS